MRRTRHGKFSHLTDRDMGLELDGNVELKFSNNLVRLDYYDAWHKIQERFRAKVTEKEKGCLMLEKIEERFNISQIDREEFRKKMREKEMSDFKELSREHKTLIGQKVIWRRDKQGNIISPFSKSNKP